MKKISIVLMVALMSSFFGTSLTHAGTFPDVPENSPYFKAVEYFVKIQAVTGYDDGSFQPDRAVNRAEALKMVFAGSPKSFVLQKNIDQDLFPDVAKDAWFAPYIQKALELKIVGGNSDGTFAPARTVNKAELLKMLLLANQVSVENYKGTTPLSVDVAPDAWFYAYMAYAKEFGIIFPDRQGALNPAKALSRGEVLEIMYNYIKNVKGGTVQELLSRTEAKLVAAMDKVGTKDYQAALGLSQEAVNIAMEAYGLAPQELIVVDAAKTAKAFNFLVEGYISIESGNIQPGKESVESAIAKAEEITHPSVSSLKNTIIQLSKKVLAQVIAIEAAGVGGGQ